MKRRDFLATGIGAVVAGATAEGLLIAADSPGDKAAGGPGEIPFHPRDTKLNVKPVMANVIHSGVWQGPCRWRGQRHRHHGIYPALILPDGTPYPWWS